MKVMPSQIIKAQKARDALADLEKMIDSRQPAFSCLQKIEPHLGIIDDALLVMAESEATNIPFNQDALREKIAAVGGAWDSAAETIVVEFLRQTGCHPAEIELVQQNNGTEVIFSVRRRA